jgi:hypothetical protein
MNSLHFPARFRPQIERLLPQTLTVSLLSTAGLLLGLVPALQPQSLELSFNQAAHAQAVTSEEVRNYARSVLAIEPIRQTAYNEIKRISGSEQVPPIACHRPDSLNNLGREIREIAVQYCNDSITVVEDNDLSINRFNTITSSLQSDPSLATRIQEELLRLQQGASTPAP